MYSSLLYYRFWYYKQEDYLGTCLYFHLRYSHFYRLIVQFQLLNHYFNLTRFWPKSEPLWREFAMLFSYKHVLFCSRMNHFRIRSLLIEGPQYLSIKREIRRSNKNQTHISNEVINGGFIPSYHSTGVSLKMLTKVNSQTK